LELFPIRGVEAQGDRFELRRERAMRKTNERMTSLKGGRLEKK